MEIICLGNKKKITISVRGNVISECKCEDCNKKITKVSERCKSCANKKRDMSFMLKRKS